jgi:hypothetical protein
VSVDLDSGFSITFHGSSIRGPEWKLSIVLKRSMVEPLFKLAAATGFDYSGNQAYHNGAGGDDV